MLTDDGRTDDGRRSHWYTISSPMSRAFGSGELKINVSKKNKNNPLKLCFNLLMGLYLTFCSCTLYYDLSVNGYLLWTLFKRGDVSSNWNLSFLSATKYYIFCPEIFFTLTNSAYPDEMRHDGISPVFKSKKHAPENIFHT